MKILFLARPDLFSKPGGDTVQISLLKEALEEVGEEVTLMTDLRAGNREALLENHDVIHVFNLLLVYQYESLLRLNKQRHLRPSVLSPLFWDTRYYEHQSGAVQWWKKFVASAGMLIPSGLGSKYLASHLRLVAYNNRYRSALKESLEYFDVLVPNAEREIGMLQGMFEQLPPTHVAYNCYRNGADSHVGVRDRDISLLCVGRIEFRKNQRLLILAAAELRLPVCFVGSINPTEQRYWEQCVRMMKKLGVSYKVYDHLQWPELRTMYARARIHVQPSFFEAPGLSSMEAAMAGCGIVCSEVGTAREYFGEDASYCHPSDVGSLVRAIQDSLAAPERAGRLHDRIATRFSPAIVGKQTMDAYHLAFARFSQEVKG